MISKNMNLHERKYFDMKDMGTRFKEAQRQQEEEKREIRRIWIFLLIVFAMTYAVEIFMIMPLVGSADAEMAMMAQMLKASVMFVPSFAVIVTRAITKESFVGKGMMINVRLKGNLKYYGLAWFGVAGLIIVGAALYFILFPSKFDPQMGYVKSQLLQQAEITGEKVTDAMVRQMVLIQMVMGIFLSPFANLLNCFGEEWGWRGYLLPKLLKQFKTVPAILIDGVVWGLWHIPLIIMGHNYGVGYPGYPIMGIIAMCIFCMVIGVIFSYVTIKTESCIPAAMGHGMLNGFSATGLLFTSVDNPFNVFAGPMPVGLVGGLGFIIVAGVLLYKLHKQDKQNKE